MKLLRLAVLAALMAAAPAWAGPAGTVVRLKGEVRADQQSLAEGGVVEEGAVLTTGPGARVELRLIDGATLTLGEHGRLVVDRYVYDAGAAQGNAVLRSVSGVFLIATGAIGKLPDRPFKVATPVATIGIRGTQFWGGALDNPLDVLLLDGAIIVENQAGTVTLDQPNQGTQVTQAGQAPDPAGYWGPERIRRAFATVSFE